MKVINTRDDYKSVVGKYGERLKAARLKYEEFKKEIAAVEKALAIPAPATATEPERKSYESLQKSGKETIQRTVGEFIKRYDALFEEAVHTIKLYR